MFRLSDCMYAFGANLREAREDRGMSRSELAQSADMSVLTIQNIELRHAESVNLRTVFALCEALDCSVPGMLGFTEFDDEIEFDWEYIH